MKRLSTDCSISVWRGCLDVSDAQLDRLRQFLAAEELHRAARFKFRVHQARFVAGRGYLRAILADQLGVSARDLKFEIGAFGKPSLHGVSDLAFNMAHSDDEFILAVSRSPVGIDIEKIRPIPEIESLAAHVFSSAELHQWGSLPERLRLRMFLSLWTRKEALLKGIGLGITQHLKDVSVFFDERAKVEIPASLAAGSWCLRTFHDATEIWTVAGSLPNAEKCSLRLHRKTLPEI